MANIYTGLKIGWSFNMSITAALLAFGVWSLLSALGLARRRFTMLENNLNQTGASAAAAISSSGLVSAIPALTLLDGHVFSYPELAVWLLCCSSLGVFVAVLFRRQMLLRDRLPYASGIATAETLKEIYARGADALRRVLALLTAALVAALWKVAVVAAGIKAWALPGPDLRFAEDGALAKAGVGAASIGKLGFALDPSLLMVGAGAIIGVRIGVWMLIGAIVSWLLIGPYVLDQGWVKAKGADELIKVGGWLLWPGVTLLVASSLTALLFAAPQFVRAFVDSRRAAGRGAEPGEASPTGDGAGREHDFPTRWLWGGVAATTVLTLIAGHLFFGMSPFIGLAAVALTGVLAIVALRVAGETNVTPIGPMGKVTQLVFGGLDPGNVSTNLMAANVTGGSASQAGDMMHDLKTGLVIGASPKAQAISQLTGVVTGSLVGAAVYLALIESVGPKLLTPEWAAPAMAQWKTVAELFRDGFDKMPAGALDAMMWAAIAGVLMPVLEKLTPGKHKRLAPSASGIGIAFIISAATSMSFFFGGVLGWALGRWVKPWYARYGIVIAAGLIAGESLTGMVQTIIQALSGPE